MDEISEAKRRLPLPELMRALGCGEAAKSSALSPLRQESSPSFGIFQKENGNWCWKDHSTGDHGDEIDFIGKYLGLDQRESREKFYMMAGIVENRISHSSRTKFDAAMRKRDASPSKAIATGEGVNSEGISDLKFEISDMEKEGAPVFLLEALPEDEKSKLAVWRGFSLAFVEWLWEQHLVGWYDGCIAFPVHRDGELIGCHYRKSDGSWRYSDGAKAAPMIIGDAKTAGDVLFFESQWDALAMADRLGLHEGRVDAAFVVTRGAGNGKMVAGIAGESSRLVAVPQNDVPKADGKIPAEEWMKAVTEAAGRSVHRLAVPREFKDANDWLRTGVDCVALWQAAQLAKRVGKSVLSVRSVTELLGMKFDDSDNYFGDRVIAQGQPVTLLGPGGIGKSRLAMQFALSMITGRKFMDVETHATGRKWLFLQVENSNRRLNFDLKKMMDAFRFETTELILIRECLYFHTLEKDEDSFIDLENPEDTAQITSLIQDYEPEFVVIDPLNAFSSADLNSDQAMRSTVNAITRAVRKGNPCRVPFVIHHSLTGKTGAARAVGWDKSSYGRNSKVLQSWTRAQINIAPRDPDNSNVLVMSCGKNNNGRLFPEIGLIFDTDAGIYRLDENFDGEAFRSSVGIESGKGRGVVVTALDVAGLFDGTSSRPALVKRIMDEFGCGKDKAYKAIDSAEKAKVILKRKGSNYASEYYKPVNAVEND